MNVRILKVYVTMCSAMEIEPTPKGLKKFKTIYTNKE